MDAPKSAPKAENEGLGQAVDTTTVDDAKRIAQQAEGAVDHRGQAALGDLEFFAHRQCLGGEFVHRAGVFHREPLKVCQTICLHVEVDVVLVPVARKCPVGVPFRSTR